MPGSRKSSTAGRKIVRKDPLPKGRACLACKERKVKCNGQWPCSACVRHAKYEGRAFDSSCCEFRPSTSQRASSSRSVKTHHGPTRSGSSSSSSSTRSPPDSRPVTPGDLSPVLVNFPDLPMPFNPQPYIDSLAAAVMPRHQPQIAPVQPFAGAYEAFPAAMQYNPGAEVQMSCQAIAQPTMPYLNLTLPDTYKSREPPLPPRQQEPFVLDADAVSDHLSHFEQYQSIALGPEDSIAPAGLTPFLDSLGAGMGTTGAPAPFWAM